MGEPIWHLERGSGPLVACAVHNGHALREDVKPYLALSPAQRLREEDPFTGRWTAVAPSRIIGLHSRFEVDLNRPPEKALYRTPEDAWGLEVWRPPLPDDVAERSLERHAAFYQMLRELLTDLQRRHGRFVVYDIHSYNYLRGGPDSEPADAAGNPQVNVGTGTMNRERWAPLVERFMADLRRFDFPGGPLDVRENVRFFGGYLPRWIHETFPESGCALAIEVKKFFMNEWTGEADEVLLEAIEAALRSTVPGVLEELERF